MNHPEELRDDLPQELIDFIRNKDNFVIATHISPDGDGLGSSIALSIALQRLNKRVILLCKDPVPPGYKFLPGSDAYVDFEGFNLLGADKTFSNLILIDCNDIKRVTDTLQPHDVRLPDFGLNVVIDHHATESSFGNIRWIMPDSAATGIMVFYLIKKLGIEIEEKIATNLYSAIAVDTGNFRYENTSQEVFSAAAELVKAGAKPYVIYNELFESWTWNRFVLFMTILNTIEIKDQAAFIRVDREMFRKTNTSQEDIEH
ncbi:MAG: DHH family phosphoesterase, partial [Nitrospirae bacterium]|nr:DHH family phosphoesterase [Nitrospirota bacterium]